MRSPAAVREVRSGPVDRVTIPRHALTVEFSRMMALIRRVGLRLSRWTYATDREAEARGEKATVLPDGHMLEVMKWYSTSFLRVMNEQRMRAALTPEKGGMPMSPEEYDRMVLDEAKLIMERREKAGAIDVPANDSTDPGSVHYAGREVAETAASDLFDFGEGGEE